MMIRSLQRKILQQICTFLFFLVLTAGSFVPHKAQAITVIEVGKNLIVNTSAAAKDAGIFGALSLDGIAWAIVNNLIEEMLKSTIDWVNSGFKGSPAFVENFEEYLLDVTDRYALGYIWGGNLQALCSPFKLSIQLGLSAQYGAGSDGYQATCRVTDVIKNHDAFLNGDFIGGGGWDAWRDISFNPQLNAHGAYFQAQGSMRAGIVNARGESLFKIGEVGQGFRSKEECEDINGDGIEEENCRIVTPGQTIQGYLGKAISAPIDRLTVADEIDELLGALVNQLVGGVLDNLKLGGGSRRDPNAYGNAVARLEAQRQQTQTQIDQVLAEDAATASVQDQYIDLLQTSMQLILSCGGQLAHNQKRNLDNKYDDLRDELASVVSGKKNVTESMVQRFQTRDAVEIQELVESMPDQAQCAV